MRISSRIAGRRGGRLAYLVWWQPRPLTPPPPAKPEIRLAFQSGYRKRRLRTSDNGHSGK
jgi:hypothetical protein